MILDFANLMFSREYLALFGSLILVALEVFVRIITLGLPQPIIRFCYNTSKKLFNRLSSPTSKQARSQRKSRYSAIATCSDFTELCALYGYYAEEHVVQTKDGYLLGVHRLPFRKGEEVAAARVSAGPDSIRKPVVYLHHGLLMNSEVWVCITEEERCLPFTLVNQGYDVWLGNNRGNKYSKKSTQFSPTSSKFWDFSIEEFAFHDIPNTIDYILDTTSQPSLSYVGFSQGTAQAFATLSIHPGLNDKVNVFIALAPAMSPAGLSNGIVDALVKTSPDVLFLAFGRKSILSSATMWQSILYPPIFVRLIDMSLSFLFAWYGRNITVQQKLAAYPHLYSFTSVKSVVHWFQIIRNKSFQMYDDDGSNKFSIGASNRYYKVAKFPTRNIKTPIVLVYGGSDSLVDIRVMLKELPRHTIATEIPHYEHLDFLWAQDVQNLVFPHVLEALRYYAHGRTSNGLPKGLALSIADTAHLHRRQHSGGAWSGDESSYSDYDGANDTPRTPRLKSYAQQLRERPYRQQYIEFEPSPRTATPREPEHPRHSPMAWYEQNYDFPRHDAQAIKDGRADESYAQQNASSARSDTATATKQSDSIPTTVSTGTTTQSPQIGTDAKAAVPQSISVVQDPASTAQPEQEIDDEGEAQRPITPQTQGLRHSRSASLSASGSGRSSPISQPAFTARGIRIGSSKPSVGPTTS
ncbi:cholesterol esterase [Elasticomyces elasticus]|uniref:Cholesterol esterase n=1 Tax=Exophiala sideris TaxID=1016849 RepID=A0ABR0J722_9EURO|nr:cholesterol esterase [Elasticomyces elasticus]KAK5029403.1 cholesterol esterase [Exophiala sideris]KAK5036899.1 cholesterol esterase [Exophiala sideris]KAK5058033.1 cholesterol esterase [Exophiala sideris]KAK5181992.1 cholesterol esterase [Eurotiomycetes sp. CCFEE 6388]